MRKFSLAVVGFAVAALLAAPGATAQTEAGDSVTGGASFSSPGSPGSPPFFLSFLFDAHSGPSGENPTGTARWEATTPFGNFGGGGPVTCLNVTGGTAIVGTFEGGVTTFFYVGATVGVGAAVGFGSFEAASAPTACEIGFFGGLPFSQAFEPRAMTSSGIVIHDAPPLPTSKDQCAKDGWRNFGTSFKTQGDCVSFVATRGKHQPAR
jgi:hypothetical protein